MPAFGAARLSASGVECSRRPPRPSSLSSSPPSRLHWLVTSSHIDQNDRSRHRKVRLDDLLEYRRRQRIQAELAFADMVADTERLGLYDADPAEVQAALKAARRKSEN